MFDPDDVARLLHIAEKTLAFPKLQTIHRHAMDQLEKIAATINEPIKLEGTKQASEEQSNEPRRV